MPQNYFERNFFQESFEISRGSGELRITFSSDFKAASGIEDDTFRDNFTDGAGSGSTNYTEDELEEKISTMADDVRQKFYEQGLIALRARKESAPKPY